MCQKILDGGYQPNVDAFLLPLLVQEKPSLIFKWLQLLVGLWLEPVHPGIPVLGFQVGCKAIPSFVG